MRGSYGITSVGAILACAMCCSTPGAGAATGGVCGLASKATVERATGLHHVVERPQTASGFCEIEAWRGRKSASAFATGTEMAITIYPTIHPTEGETPQKAELNALKAGAHVTVPRLGGAGDQGARFKTGPRQTTLKGLWWKNSRELQIELTGARTPGTLTAFQRLANAVVPGFWLIASL